MTDENKAPLAIVPPPEVSPGVADAVEKITASDAAKLQRKMTDALKAGILDSLKKIAAQVARSTDLNFQALRATSVQRHPEGQDLVVVVDMLPKVYHDGPINVGS